MSRKNAPNAASEEEEEEEEEEEVGDDVEEEVRLSDDDDDATRRRKKKEGTTKRGGNAVERWSWVQGGWFVCVNSMGLGLVDTWQPRGSKSEAKSEASVGSRAEERSRVGSGARGVLFSFTRVDALGEWFTDEE